MKSVMACAILLVMAGTPALGRGAEAGVKQRPGQEASLPTIQYLPPKLGRPAVRIGGGSRGEGQAVTLVALAPDHVALCATPAPVLCWHQSCPIAGDRLLVLDDGQGVKPMLEQKIGDPNRAGIQCVGVERFGVALQADVEYRWYLAAVIDPAHRSKDVVSGGAVMFKAPSPELAGKIKGSDSRDVPSLLAANGYWYDAFANVMAGLTRHQEDPSYQEMKAALLRQIGLPLY